MSGEVEFRAGDPVTVTIGESRFDATVLDPPNIGGWGRVRIPNGKVVVASAGMMKKREAK
jgi:hypothetical protein